MFFCFIAHSLCIFTQNCTVNSVFHSGFLVCFIMCLKCKCYTENNAMKTIKYFLQNKSMKVNILTKIKIKRKFNKSLLYIA